MGLSGCAPPDDRPHDSPHPNIIIYLVDTLRADHLGLYGYARDTSPALDGLARDAVVFDHAYTPSAWTRPAVASLLSGLHPQNHRAIRRGDALGTDVHLLSEYLQPLGYRTAGIVTNPNVIALWGFDQGYDVYRDLPAPQQHPRADAVNAAVFSHLDGLGEGAFFLYVHVMDPHGPFAPPAPYDTKYPRQRRRAIRPSFIKPGTPRAVVDDAVSAYDGEIAFSDFHFGQLISRLKADGLYEEALIILAADHGEELHDHGYGGHGHTLYQELVHVPLLIKFPGNAYAGQRIERAVSLIDVVPTVLGFLDVAPARELDGVDLMPVVRNRSAVSRDMPIYLHLDLERADGGTHVVRAVLHGSRKYIRRLGPEAGEMLFDVENDPGERENLLAADPQTAVTLGGMLDAYERHTSGVVPPAGKPPDVPAAVQDRLRALGYVGTPGPEEEDR
jgi:arylsulfatase A-like enzyme